MSKIDLKIATITDAATGYRIMISRCQREDGGVEYLSEVWYPAGLDLGQPTPVIDGAVSRALNSDGTGPMENPATEELVGTGA